MSSDIPISLFIQTYSRYDARRSRNTYQIHARTARSQRCDSYNADISARFRRNQKERRCYFRKNVWESRIKKEEQEMNPAPQSFARRPIFGGQAVGNTVFTVFSVSKSDIIKRPRTTVFTFICLLLQPQRRRQPWHRPWGCCPCR